MSIATVKVHIDTDLAAEWKDTLSAASTTIGYVAAALPVVREALGMTRAAVHEQTAVAEHRLAKIEQGKVTPTLMEAWSIAAWIAAYKTDKHGAVQVDVRSDGPAVFNASATTDGAVRVETLTAIKNVRPSAETETDLF